MERLPASGTVSRLGRLATGADHASTKAKAPRIDGRAALLETLERISGRPAW